MASDPGHLRERKKQVPKPVTFEASPWRRLFLMRIMGWVSRRERLRRRLSGAALTEAGGHSGKENRKKLFNGEGFCYNRFNVKTE